MNSSSDLQVISSSDLQLTSSSDLQVISSSDLQLTSSSDLQLTSSSDLKVNDNPKPKKTHLEKAKQASIKKRAKEIIAVHIIEHAWLAHVYKTMFQLLKHTICAVEHYVAYEVLKGMCPLEAQLIKDPSMKYKVRFRFSGEEFPPFIVFKIFLHTEGRGYKYISGKNIMKSSNETLSSACKMMGNSKFTSQILEDERLFQQFKITDEVDIVTLKDYMQYTSLMDEIPAYSGGRNNQWRRLTLQNLPRTMMIYDIVDYSESGTISDRLQKEMRYLSQRPKTEEMRQHQLRIISEVRFPSPSLSIKPTYLQPYRKQSEVKHLGRRSKQAQMKVEKMRKAYKAHKEENAPPEPKKSPRVKKQEIIFSTPSFDIVKVRQATPDEEWGREEEELYAWSQASYYDKSV
ncbi:PREDICTED: putative uncharacterized protein CXorf58 homolog [Elephantulus edwardii]|uniref:putative uncharacterized protein CXorf58 homolog n=1 Tax=Elephantulus edwardii TaxID=28737 RepID=UPI0003F0A2FD|nr:PREDICTED: putative uncharacterized protein CXorf58 homolog [Elephantulus edwardii]